jgi:hypothetical protein
LFIGADFELVHAGGWVQMILVQAPQQVTTTFVEAP